MYIVILQTSDSCYLPLHHKIKKKACKIWFMFEQDERAKKCPEYYSCAKYNKQ